MAEILAPHEAIPKTAPVSLPKKQVPPTTSPIPPTSEGTAAPSTGKAAEYKTTAPTQDDQSITPTPTTDEGKADESQKERKPTPGTDDEQKGKKTTRQAENKQEKSAPEIQKEIVDPAWNSAYHQVMTMDEAGLEKSGLPVEQITAIKVAIAHLKQLDSAPDGTVSYDTSKRAYVLTVGKGEPIDIPSASLIDAILDAEKIIAADTTNPEAAVKAAQNINVFNTYRTADRAGLKAKTAREIEDEINNEATKNVATLLQDTLECFAEQNSEQPDEHVATLSLIAATYQDIFDNPNSQGQRDNLMTLAYVHLRNIKLDTITDPRLRERLESLQKGNALFDDKEDGRIAKLENSISKHWLEPHRLGRIPLVQLTRDMILAMRLETIKGVQIMTDARGQFERFQVGDDVEKLLAGWGVRDDERQNIFSLATGDHSAGRLMSQEFGLDIRLLTEPKSADEVAQKALTALTKSAADRGRPKDYYSKEKQEAFLKFFLNNLSEESLKKFAEKHGLPQGTGMIGIGILMLLPMLQGLMDTGSGGGGEGQGHR